MYTAHILSNAPSVLDKQVSPSASDNKLCIPSNPNSHAPPNSVQLLPEWKKIAFLKIIYIFFNCLRQATSLDFVRKAGREAPPL